MENYTYSKNSSNPFKRLWQVFSSPTHSRTLGILTLLIIVAAVPLTIYIAQKQQEVRQRAAATLPQGSQYPPTGVMWTDKPAPTAVPVGSTIQLGLGGDALPQTYKDAGVYYAKMEIYALKMDLSTNPPTVLDISDGCRTDALTSDHKACLIIRKPTTGDANYGSGAQNLSTPWTPTKKGDYFIVGNLFTNLGRSSASPLVPWTNGIYCYPNNPTFCWNYVDLLKTHVVVTDGPLPTPVSNNPPGGNITGPTTGTIGQKLHYRLIGDATPGKPITKDEIYIAKLKTDGTIDITWRCGSPFLPGQQPGWCIYSRNFSSPTSHVQTDLDWTPDENATYWIAMNLFSEGGQCSGNPTIKYISHQNYCGSNPCWCPKTDPTPDYDRGFYPEGYCWTRCDRTEGVDANDITKGGDRIKVTITAAGPTSGPTSGPQPTSPQPTTPIPTGQPTQRPTSTPTTQPTGSPAPTNTPIPGGTQLALNLILDGIFYDCNVNSPCITGAPKPPLHPTRDVTVDIFADNSATQPILEKTGPVTYNAGDGHYKGNVELGDIATGDYIVKAKTSEHLRRTIEGIQHVVKGTTNNTPETVLIAGDIDNNNALDILDYNLLISCLEDQNGNTPAACGANKDKTDLNDNGKVDIDDYNLFIRSLAVQRGD
ncbi:MAG: hypothetical protein M1268_04850 [Patescibacteria group bacterium]|nr:hypothetical protein [Patescibacteria group bacterium]